MNHSAAAIAHLHQDQVLRQCLISEKACPLFEPTRNTTLFAELSRAIISQQLHPKAAATIHQRYLDLFQAEPNPTELLQLSFDERRSPGLSKQKALYITDLAESIASESIPVIEELAQWDDEHIIKTLIQIKGVGPWTAQMLLIFRLHRLDVLPTDDFAIRKKIQQLYGLAERPNALQMKEIAEPWQPYRSVACWYLWQWEGL